MDLSSLKIIHSDAFIADTKSKERLDVEIFRSVFIKYVFITKKD